MFALHFNQKKGFNFSPYSYNYQHFPRHKTLLLASLISVTISFLVSLDWDCIQKTHPIPALLSASRTELLPICFNRLLRSKDSAKNSSNKIMDSKERIWKIFGDMMQMFIAFFLSASISFCNWAISSSDGNMKKNCCHPLSCHLCQMRHDETVSFLLVFSPGFSSIILPTLVFSFALPGRLLSPSIQSSTHDPTIWFMTSWWDFPKQNKVPDPPST